MSISNEDVVESDELPAKEHSEDVLTPSPSDQPTLSEDATTLATDLSTNTQTTAVSSSLESSVTGTGEMITETVFGFLNLVTTVRDTVIVFTTLGMS